MAGVPIAFAAPTEASRYFEDAQRLYERGELPAAIVQLKNSIQQNRAQIAAHLLLGKALIGTGDMRGAEIEFLEAIAQGADRGELAVPLAHVYLELDQSARALDVLPQRGLAREVQVEALSLRGRAYLALGNDRQATQAFADARALDPNSVIVTLEEVPLLLRSGQARAARDAAQAATALAPSDWRVWSLYGVVLRDTGDVKAGLAAFDKAVELSGPKRIDARLGRAALLIDLGRSSDARPDVDAAFAIWPKDLRVLALRAAVARDSRDAAAARQAYTELVAVLDALPAAWLNAREKFGMMAAVAHHGLGDRQKALSVLSSVLARNPKHFEARALTATIYLEMGDYAHAQPVLDSLARTSSDDPGLLYQRGVAFFGTGRYAQAVSVLEVAAARTRTPEVRRALAAAQIKVGMVDKGVAALEQVFQASVDAEAGRQLVGVYLDRGQAKKALAIAETMGARWKDDVRVLDFLGTVRGSTGDAKGAREVYNRVLARQPDLKVTALNLVKLDVHEHNFDAARARLAPLVAQNDSDALYELGMLERRAGRHDEALRMLLRTVDLGPPDRRALEALVEELIGLRQADRAVQTAKAAEQKNPGDVGVKLLVARAQLAAARQDLARAELQDATVLADFDPDWQVRIGRLQLLAGNPAGAAYNVQKALQGRADDLQAMLLAVAVALAQNQVTEADKAQQALLQRHPQRREAELSGAHLALARGQGVAAVAAYRRIYARQPQSDLALYLGRAEVMSGDPAAAARTYQDWLKRSPGDQPVLRALAEAQMQAGQLAAARETYTSALLVEPNDGQMLNNLANVQLGLRDNRAAQSLAQAALKVEPNEPSYLATFARSLMQQGQFEAALQPLREARLRRPESVPIRWHLSLALQQLGRTDEARRELQALLQGTPSVAQRAEVAKLKSDLGI